MRIWNHALTLCPSGFSWHPLRLPTRRRRTSWRATSASSTQGPVPTATETTAAAAAVAVAEAAGTGVAAPGTGEEAEGTTGPGRRPTTVTRGAAEEEGEGTAGEGRVTTSGRGAIWAWGRVARFLGDGLLSAETRKEWVVSRSVCRELIFFWGGWIERLLLFVSLAGVFWDYCARWG